MQRTEPELERSAIEQLAKESRPASGTAKLVTPQVVMDVFQSTGNHSFSSTKSCGSLARLSFAGKSFQSPGQIRGSMRRGPTLGHDAKTVPANVNVASNGNRLRFILVPPVAFLKAVLSK
jgi:hypothetical protein